MDRSVPALTLVVLLTATACDEIPEDPLFDSTPSSREAAVPMATVARINLGTLGGASSYATDVNDLGTVVGWSTTAAGGTRAFRWTITQGMTDLGTLPGDDWSRAVSITNTGEILGVSGRADDVAGSPVVWTPSGTATPLSIPLSQGSGFLLPENRNAADLVTGSTGGGSHPSHAWAWSALLGLYDITAHLPDFSSTGFGESYASDVNSWGVVVGTNHARVCTDPRAGGECWHAFLWNALTGYRDIGIPVGNRLASAQVTGAAINALGVVVGWTSPRGAFPPLHAYVWHERTGFTTLPNFSADTSSYGGYAEAVNLLGTAVGASEDPELGAIQAAAWPKAGGIVKLSPDDPNPSVAVAISGSGIVAGWSSLDCCGFVGNHATLWKLGPGRGTTPPAATGVAASPNAAIARAWSESAQLGPVACLSNRAAVRSKASLVGCMVESRY